jgi:hypothetical protein
VSGGDCRRNEKSKVVRDGARSLGGEGGNFFSSSS